MTDESDVKKMNVRYATCLAEVKNATKEKRTRVHNLVKQIVESALTGFDHPGGAIKLEEMQRGLVNDANSIVDCELEDLDAE